MNATRIGPLAFALAMFAAATAGALEFSAEEVAKIAQHSPLGPPPPDPSNAVADDPAAARLGQTLFFDRRLSAHGNVDCTTCHDPERAFTNGAPRGTGSDGRQTRRHVPTLLNNAYNRWYTWDGRADSAWAQATQPLESLTEHAADRMGIVRIAASDPQLRSRYRALFGPVPDFSDLQRFPEHAAPMPHDSARARAWRAMAAGDRHEVDRMFTNLAKAIAAYERKLVSRDSAFDRFVAQLVAAEPGSAPAAISESAQRGLRLFIGRGNCRLCHSGPNFSDGEFHDTALPRDHGLRDTGRWGGIERLLMDPFNSAGAFSDGEKPELRFLYRRQDSSGQFKTPTLRDVSRTAPYMHTGQFRTLRDVLRFYSTRENIPRTHGEQGMIRRLDLTGRELDDLEAFLGTLDGRPLPDALLARPATPEPAQTIVPASLPQ